MADKKLNARQKKFIDEYLIDQNGTHAAIRAGYAKNSAEVTASKLLRNPKVAAYLEKRQAGLAKKVDVTIESLAEELDEARSTALTEKQSNAAISATMGKVKLFGLGSENRKISGTIQVVTITSQQLDGLTEDELAVLEAAYPILEKLGIVGGGQSAATTTGK